MLPIVNDSVKGEKVSIYNPSVQPKHPLNGLRLKNSTDLNLMQGPITVFDAGVYAGDARIEDLPPGSERLISYALDLDVEVAPTSHNIPERMLSAKLSKGVLYVDYRYTRSQEYVVKNSAKKDRKVLVEYPLDTAWKLTAPKEPSEKTRDLYRFAVDAKPGKPTSLKIEEERVVNQQVAVNNLDNNAIAIYLNAKVISDKVKDALKEVVKRKLAIEEVVKKKQQVEAQLAAIDQEQNRIRQNMQQLDRNGELYKRYVKKFSDQEDQVEKMRGQVSELQGQETQQRKNLDEFLGKLEIS
jgi:hypothetical protein